MDFYELGHEEIKELLREVYDEYAEDVIHAAEEYKTDTRSVAKRNHLRSCQNEFRTVEHVLEAIGLDFEED